MTTASKRTIALFLVLGNLVSLATWWLGQPIGTGLPYVALALCVYGFIGAMYRANLAKAVRWRLPRFQIERALVALGIGMVVTMPAILFLMFPVVVGHVQYRGLARVPLSALVARVLVYIPLVTALSEELLFRLYVLERQRAGWLVGKVLANSALFTAWHVVVALRTVMETNLAQDAPLTAVSYVAALGSIFIGGLVFCVVRIKLGSWIYSWITHAVTDVVLNVVAWLALN